jgi:hypothetical protein
MGGVRHGGRILGAARLTAVREVSGFCQVEGTRRTPDLGLLAGPAVAEVGRHPDDLDICLQARKPRGDSSWFAVYVKSGP